MVTISNRDKEMIIWNFMEELCDKYLYASENNLPTDFNVKDFRNMNIFSKYLVRRGVSGVNGSSGDALVLVTLKKYAEIKGLITVEGDIIALTEKGISERHKIHRDWDGI
jgi:hypothetical protein